MYKDRYRNTMTARELRDALSKAIEDGHGDQPVVTEGCDCDGDAFDVSVTADGDVYITRNGAYGGKSYK